MIEIINATYAFTILGHANDGTHALTKEETEACAAVTALAHGLINAIYEHSSDKPTFVMKKGHFMLCKPLESKNAKLIFKSYLTGFQAVASGYPDLIRFLK